MNRRHFLQSSAALWAAATLSPAHAVKTKLRMAVIGTGMRGQVLLTELLRRTDVEVMKQVRRDEPLYRPHRSQHFGELVVDARWGNKGEPAPRAQDCHAGGQVEAETDGLSGLKGSDSRIHD